MTVISAYIDLFSRGEMSGGMSGGIVRIPRGANSPGDKQSGNESSGDEKSAYLLSICYDKILSDTVYMYNDYNDYKTVLIQLVSFNGYTANLRSILLCLFNVLKRQRRQ